VPYYNIDEDEFAEMFEEYMETGIYNYMDMHVLDLFLGSEEEIEEAYSLVGTIPFEDILRQLDPRRADVEEIEPVPFADPFGTLTNMGFSDEDIEHLLGLEAGEVSRIMITQDAEGPVFSLIKMVSRQEADIEAADESLRERHIFERRSEIFGDLVTEWTEAANFQVLERGYNSV